MQKIIDDLLVGLWIKFRLNILVDIFQKLRAENSQLTYSVQNSINFRRTTYIPCIELNIISDIEGTEPPYPYKAWVGAPHLLQGNPQDSPQSSVLSATLVPGEPDD